MNARIFSLIAGMLVTWVSGSVVQAQSGAQPANAPPAGTPPPTSGTGVPPTPVQAPSTAGAGVPPSPQQPPPTSGAGVPGSFDSGLPPTQPGTSNAVGTPAPGGVGNPVPFRTMDLNGDGTISGPEASADPAIVARFQNLDTDGDGRLSSAEFNQGRNNPGTPSPVSPDNPQN